MQIDKTIFFKCMPFFLVFKSKKSCKELFEHLNQSQFFFCFLKRVLLTSNRIEFSPGFTGFILLLLFFMKVRGFLKIYLFGHLEMNDYLLDNLLCRSIFQGLTRKICSFFCYKNILFKICNGYK